MIRIYRYLILIAFISVGYYLFISEYSDLLNNLLEKKIGKREIAENKNGVIIEKGKGIDLSNIDKKSYSDKYTERKIKILQGDTFVSILENLQFKQKKNLRDYK